MGTFSFNTGVYGGALSVWTGSRVSWSGSTGFFSNSASRSGGAIEINTESTVSWSGATTLACNTTSADGGAVSVSTGSNVFWSSSTDFLSDSALFWGGAVAVSHESMYHDPSRHYHRTIPAFLERVSASFQDQNHTEVDRIEKPTPYFRIQKFETTLFSAQRGVG